MSRPRDSQRSRCYKAERAAVARVPGREIGPRFTRPRLANVQTYVDDVTRSDWWRAHAGYVGTVLVLETDRTRKAVARSFTWRREGRETWYRAQPNIALPEWPAGSWAWCDWVLLHELAHVARFTPNGIMRQDEPSHSREWAGTFLALVREFMGENAAQALREQFRALRVRHVPPEPVQLEMGDVWAVAARER